MKKKGMTPLALLAIAVTAVALWLSNGALAPGEATWDDVKAEAAEGGYRIITTDQLLKWFDAEPQSFLLVDTRQEWEYRTGHIKGAVNFPMEPTWYSRWRKKGDLAALLGADKQRPIIFY